MEEKIIRNKVLPTTKLYTAAGAPQQIVGFVLPSKQRLA
jgi:hypothetical protein